MVHILFRNKMGTCFDYCGVDFIFQYVVLLFNVIGILSYFLFTISTIISDSIFRIKSATPQTRKSYPIPYKLMIIEEAKRTGNNSIVARTHGMSESLIREWRKDEVKLRTAYEQGSQKLRIHSKDPLN